MSSPSRQTTAPHFTEGLLLNLLNVWWKGPGRNTWEFPHWTCAHIFSAGLFFGHFPLALRSTSASCCACLAAAAASHKGLRLLKMEKNILSICLRTWLFFIHTPLNLGPYRPIYAHTFHTCVVDAYSCTYIYGYTELHVHINMSLYIYIYNIYIYASQSDNMTRRLLSPHSHLYILSHLMPSVCFTCYPQVCFGSVTVWHAHSPRPVSVTAA